MAQTRAIVANRVDGHRQRRLLALILGAPGTKDDRVAVRQILRAARFPAVEVRDLELAAAVGTHPPQLHLAVAVYVADANAGKPQWKPAGIRYLAGSNTCVYSNPEADKPQIAGSENEFLMPRDLTEGRSAIRIRVHFTPVNRPLFSGYPMPELALSEIRYTSYSFMLI
jgi:hypothetical protein